MAIALASDVVAQPAVDQSEVPTSGASGVYESSATTPRELLDFVQSLIAREPEDVSEQQQLAETRKIARSIVVAADKALGANPQGQEVAESHYFKLQAIDILRQLGEPGADAKLAKAIEGARSHDDPDVAGVGMKFFIESAMERWAVLTAKQKQELVDAIVSHVERTGVDPSQAQTLLVVADFMGNAEDFELGQKMLDKLLPLFRKHASPQIQGALPMLEGVARRLGLPGHKLELSGTLLDGEKLDWSEYEGKVVLVDFWASWCGPCQQELPNVLRMYRAYHEKGFEVVGICLDDDATQAESFVQKRQLPWATLFSHNPEKQGWENPLAVEFGVTGIPFAILLDAEGKVVSMDARGPKLEKLLRRQLGNPIEVGLDESQRDERVVPASGEQ
ncbi:MAG: TlpA family protein disulfide reductase [Planctomycetales bacterium]|nr:TlpA family protein disulfide reductase [Planctomycetales bacterium]